MIPATDQPPFGSHRFRIPFDASGKKWVRFSVWDSAGNGAFTQPVQAALSMTASTKQGTEIMTRRKVGILVFPEVEVLDFCGPFEVFSVTRLDEDRRREEPSPYEVVLVAEKRGARRRHGRSEGRFPITPG